MPVTIQATRDRLQEGGLLEQTKKAKNVDGLVPACTWCPSQQEGYELMETQDGTGVVIVVDYLVKTSIMVRVFPCSMGTQERKMRRTGPCCPCAS
eukprot:1157652-Pelagomonas_calceolata.AAC.12